VEIIEAKNLFIPTATKLVADLLQQMSPQAPKQTKREIKAKLSQDVDFYL
jgi:hypothetical protein